jgi:Ca2+:H+ antiporter
MPPSEQTPLINGNWRQSRNFHFYPKVVAFLNAEDEPSWVDSFRWFFFGSWWNLLLLLVPVAAAAEYFNWDAPLRFAFSFVAIMPLAKVCNSLNCFHNFAGF